MKCSLSTTLTKAEATQFGKKLLKMMKSRNWSLRVHENDGWHYSVDTEFLSVSYSINGFLCMFKPHLAEWRVGGRSSNPNEAVRSALLQLDAHVQAELSFLRAARHSIE